jgi:uncharacterized protein (TIGR02147 family)
MADIFTYLDYRAFLNDAFKALKAARRGFSHRAFARIAGFSSSNFILLVMQGKRNLSGEAIQKVAKALKLKKAEAEFFENLVRFNQATSDAERNFYYSRIASNRHYAQAKPLEKGQFDYYSTWYIPAIREMVLLDDFEEDPAWIAAQLQPPITPREAESALKLLIDLGLLIREKSGRLIQQDRHIASGDEVSSLAMTNFQREMIERAAASIDATPADLREIGSITFAVSKDKLGQAKKMIREFRSRLAGFLSEESNADAVYQFNIQLFNLSKGEENG